MTKVLTIRTDSALTTDHDPIGRWDEAVSRYLATRKGGPEGNTAKTYGRTLQSYKDLALESSLNPWGADALIAYNAYQNELRGKLADDTIAARLVHMGAFFRWCYGYKLTPITPEMVKDILDKPPKKQLSPRDIPDPREVKVMLENTKSAKEHALVRVLADAGLRVSEAISLTSEDVYLAGGRWYIYVVGKGDKSREVEVSEDLAQELLALVGEDERPIFDMDRTTAFRWVKRIAERASVSKSISPHSLRHAHAHNLRLAGYSLEATSHRLGHASIETTKRYTRPAEMARAEALPTMPWD